MTVFNEWVGKFYLFRLNIIFDLCGLENLKSVLTVVQQKPDMLLKVCVGNAIIKIPKPSIKSIRDIKEELQTTF